MHDHLFFDGKMLTPSESMLSPITNAVLYGRGVFTTIPVYDRRPFLWEKHWSRLCKNAARLSLEIGETSEDALRALEDIIEKNSVVNGRARLTFLDVSTSKIWDPQGKQKTDLLIITGARRHISDDFRLTISPYSVNSGSPLSNIKSCNYLEKILALDEAKEQGFIEAIRVNERGEIASATMANVFWLKDEILHTPSLSTGCLPGTTREFIMENLEVLEVERPLEDLNSVDAIFLTSAGVGVALSAEFGSRRFAPIDHPILHLLPDTK